MANAVYKGDQIGRAIHATQDCGNGWTDDSKLTVAANLVTTDKLMAMYIPAGVRLQGLRYRSGDLDTGTTLTMNFGYQSAHGTPQVVAAPTYFLAASAAFQAAVAGWTELVFEAITFQEPVWLVMVPAVAATGISGTPSIWLQAQGAMVGAV